MSTVSWLVLPADRLDQRAALAVDHLRQTIGLLLHVADDFVGLAGHGRAEALLAASTERSMSAEVDLTLELASFDAATSVFCALSALVWILSVVLVVTVESDRSSSVEIALIWLAASADVSVSELCASRALLRIEAAVSAPTAVSVRSTSVASDLTWLAASRGCGHQACWASRAPAVIDFGGGCSGDRQRPFDVGASDLTCSAASAMR